MSKKSKKFLIFSIILIFIISIFVIKSQIKSSELKILESSASTIQLTTGHEVNRRSQDRKSKPFIGKPKQTEVRIEYKPIINYTKNDTYNEIVGILEKNNWVKEELSIAQYGYYRATLPQKYFTILIEVLIHSKNNTVSINLTTFPH
jgi:hypothetical protein